ncbi:MAG: hypothetical protein ABMB14_25830 [Myxococcota bacterium]
MIRSLFVGEVLFEAPMGTVRTWLRWSRQTALVARIDGRPEVFLEQVGGLGPLPGGVAYLHLPEDGLDAVEEAGLEALRGPLVAPTLGDRFARGVTALSRFPARLGFVTFVGAWCAVVVSIATCGFGGLVNPAGLRDLGATPLLVFGGWMVGAFLLEWGVMGLIALVHGEAMATTRVRCHLGRPGQVRSMGTWRGPLGTRGFGNQHTRASLQVMAAQGRERWLVMTRSHRSWQSSGIALYATPIDQVPALLRAIAFARGQRPAGAR